ncbi:hypothetical protein ABZS29_38595 [Kribbella sp. NPDC005582]|uniref:hypothetical protein n=1 Tax=Kribbella sp. NPDC005582 TaxID=3156893 RepID=UPI0033B3EFB4
MSAARLTDRGRFVRMTVSGPLPSYAEVRVRAVHESRSAVLAEIVEVPYRPGSGMPLVAVGRPVSFRLRAALGARVLVLSNGVPVEVIPVG